MGRKVEFNLDPKVLMIIAAGVSLIITTGCMGMFDKDHDDDDNENIIPDQPVICTVDGLVDDMGNISIVLLDIDLYGYQGVDMRDVVMHITVTLKDGLAASCDLVYGSFGQIDSESYGIRELFDPNNTWDPDDTPAHYILGKDCILELEVNLTASAVPLPPDSTLEITLHVTTSSHETIDYFRTPSVYPANGTVSLED